MTIDKNLKKGWLAYVLGGTAILTLGPASMSIVPALFVSAFLGTLLTATLGIGDILWKALTENNNTYSNEELRNDEFLDESDVPPPPYTPSYNPQYTQNQNNTSERQEETNVNFNNTYIYPNIVKAPPPVIFTKNIPPIHKTFVPNHHSNHTQQHTINNNPPLHHNNHMNQTTRFHKVKSTFVPKDKNTSSNFHNNQSGSNVKLVSSKFVPKH
jgi:hypothetical protein